MTEIHLTGIAHSIAVFPLCEFRSEAEEFMTKILITKAAIGPLGCCRLRRASVMQPKRTIVVVSGFFRML
jgi:hypothetical protein